MASGLTAPLRQNDDNDMDAFGNTVSTDYTAMEQAAGGGGDDDGDGGHGGGHGAKGHAAAATVNSSIFNVSNTILGSGTLAMPFACHECGIIPFLGLLGAFAYSANLALRLLVICLENCANLHDFQYAALAKRTIGRKGELAAEWAVIVQQCGACVAYIVIIADVLQPIASLGAADEHSPMCSRALWQALAAVTIIFPLCMLRRLDSLRHTSLVALGCIVAFVFAVTVNGLRALGDHSLRHAWSDGAAGTVSNVCSGPDTAGLLQPGSNVKLFPNSAGIISSLPITCFAFLCHMNAFPVYEELKDRGGGRKRTDFYKVGDYSMLICACVYALSGVFGYLIFLDATEGDLLKNFHVRGTSVSALMDALRVGFGFALIFSYPVVVWEARHGLELQIFGHGKAFSWRRHFLLNVGIVGGSLLVGIAVPTVIIPLGLVGSTCSPLIVFILPAQIFLHMKRNRMLEKDPALSPEELDALERKATAALWTGYVLIPLCSVLWLKDQIG